ncbi:MAG: FAD-dependent oxidoreductase [Comamonadaceae bacterium CG_4_9_14_0_8_um_filter_60_18]|nr:FAD-dependent oxidoreductase [Rhodoferax sp.]PIW06431.1 MAG: FAD-dependent oxidoreductase [Comamonadaceae bacterium CG17_big_fil_post_rev_8_21_14_2_50_60_13]PIY24733.1 MAG: FAD-dependent oxidoreductase [Comamonadaceae bacterium CG_4_10_14_3_um_filter_60_75]PJC11712.1 MAG: FAD-dependent oxidoreductase [Comamonadaceae bacterium CG_4_9_14_0_8_um_filter_60_18]
MIVAGAGIVGAAIAFFLTRAGVKVTLLDARWPAAGASGASDGAVSVASKRPGQMMALACEARTLYGQWVDQGIMRDIYHPRPTYLFARTDEEVAVIAHQGSDLMELGERILPLTHAELMQRVPGLGRHVLAGMKVPDDGHALGYQVVDRLLQASGAQVLRNTPVQRLALSDDRVVGVVTPAGTLVADRVVVAAGLGTGLLTGLQDILIPRKGQLIVTDRASLSGAALRGPLLSAGYLAAKRRMVLGQSSISLVIDPLATGQFLIGSSRETGFADRQTDVQTVSTLLREALAVYPALARQRVIRTFAGIRIGTQDGLPIVGRHPTLPGLFIASGMEGDGICLAPVIGAAVADMVRDQPPRFDVSALKPGRFGDLPLRQAN